MTRSVLPASAMARRAAFTALHPEEAASQPRVRRLRLLWQRCKDAGTEYTGVPEEAVAGDILEATGVDIARSLREWTEGTRDPDFAQLFAPFGIVCARRAALDSPHFAMLGIKTAATPYHLLAHARSALVVPFGR